MTSSNQTTQRLDGIIFSEASVDKNTRRRIKYEPRTPPLHTKVATFVLMSYNGGQSYRKFVVQKVGLLVSHGLKFGMVGTYNTYFRNIKRKGKVTS